MATAEQVPAYKAAFEKVLAAITELEQTLGKSPRELRADGNRLEARRARLRNIVATPSDREIAARELMQVETEIAERDRGALQAEADKRTLGITRAHGSLSDQLEQDIRRVVVAADAFAAEWRRMVERYVQLGVLRGEYDALVDGFALAKP